jgi:glycosyltransferase involved in cell wall biosynthesis
MRLLFLYLRGFSLTGGIEKFNRSFLKALHELSVDGIWDATAISSHDTTTDEKYFPRNRFRGLGGNKLAFSLTAIKAALKNDVLVIGHMNLAIIGCLIKLIKPSIKLVVVTHGIEVWKTHTGFRKQLLEKATLILSVSQFTKDKIVANNPQVSAQKIFIFPNTIDPYFNAPKVFEKPNYLLNRYKLAKETELLITVTRLSFSEKYKGYDNTIVVIKQLVQEGRNIHYLICGKADDAEKNRIEQLIHQLGLEQHVTLAGFIKDEELIDHYLLGDIFVLPSKKEGFGIVFIEALACGLSVIAGSKDGSVDALMNGKLGILIDPDSSDELEKAVHLSLGQQIYNPKQMQQQVYDAFGFKQYKARLKKALTEA